MALSYGPLLADVYWIRAIQHYGDTKRSTRRRQELRAPVSAARPHHLARSAVQRRLHVRRDLSGRARPGRSRPARPGHPAPAEGAEGAARQLAAAAVAGVHLLLVARGLPHRRLLVRPSRQAPRRADLDGAARGRHAGAGRQPRRLAADVAARRPDGIRRVVPQRGRAAAAAARRDGPDGCAESPAGGIPLTDRSARPPGGPIWCAPACCAACRGSQRRCRITGSRVTPPHWIPRHACCRCRTRRGRDDCRRGAGAAGRQLPERLHLPAAAARVGGVAGVALPVVPAGAVVVRERAAGELAGAPRPVPQLPGANQPPVSDRRSPDRRALRRRVLLVRADGRSASSGRCSAAR